MIMKSIFLLFSLTFITSCDGQDNSNFQENTAPAQENQDFGRMWAFENPPLTYLEKEYGFKPDQQWFELASARLPAPRR